jgi:malate dehydrogenase (oxaloacetate-decarboxylating)
MKNVYKESVALHRKNKGKIELKSKVKIKNKNDLSLAYTPGVAEVSRVIAKDKKKAKTLSLKANTIAVVSDGSAVLGLGNIGPEGAIPVMEGKCALFKEFAGVDAFPICLDTQDVEEIIKAVKQIAPVFGGINLEDISAPRCFEIEKRLKSELDIPVMHDDQHGTATVVLAALINALKITKLKKEEVKIVLNGSGAAGVAISKLLLKYGFKNLIILDSQGVIYKGREKMNKTKEELAKISNPYKEKGLLEDVIKGANIFIGVSKANILKKKMVKSMENPIIFALSNPIPEIMPNEAKLAGAKIVASGRSDFANQINNVLVFPGVFQGALKNKVKNITDEMLIKAAKNLAGVVKSPTKNKILPNPFDKEVVKAVARAIK